METKTKPAPDVQVSKSIKVSKAFCQRALRKAFTEARFQTTTNEEDRKAGRERLQLWCKGSYGRLVPIVEVSGEKEVLPKACLVAAFQSIGYGAEFSSGFDTNGVKTTTLTLKKLPPKKAKKEKPEAQTRVAGGLGVQASVGNEPG